MMKYTYSREMLLHCYYMLLHYYRLLLLLLQLYYQAQAIVELLSSLGYWSLGQTSPVPTPKHFSSTFGNCPHQFRHNFSADARHGASPERDQTNRALPGGAARPQSGQTEPATLRLTDWPACLLSTWGSVGGEAPSIPPHLDPAWGQGFSCLRPVQPRVIKGDTLFNYLVAVTFSNSTFHCFGYVLDFVHFRSK